MNTDEKLPRVPVGTVFVWKGEVWRRGRGILYVAHRADPTIERAYRTRVRRRELRLWRRKVALVMSHVNHVPVGRRMRARRHSCDESCVFCADCYMRYAREICSRLCEHKEA